MSHLAMQEAALNYRGSSAPQESTPSISSESPADITTLPGEFDKEFIGPHDAVDNARGLLLRRAADVALIATKNSDALPHEYERFTRDVQTAVNEGRLRLANNYPTHDAHSQMSAFIADSIVEMDLENQKDEQSVAEKELEALQKVSQAQATSIEILTNDLKTEKEMVRTNNLLLRKALVEQGASTEMLLVFDKMTHLRTALEADADAAEAAEAATVQTETDATSANKFRQAISSLISRKGLQKIGILAPRSAEISVVQGQYISKR